MTADEMLKEQGFVKSEENSNDYWLEYFDKNSIYKNIICFYYESKSFFANAVDDEMAIEIDVALLKAIIAKEKELGWLD